MSECIHCGATDDPTSGILVGAIGELNESVCTVCRSEFLQSQTVLSRREADVSAHKQVTGATHEKIAARLGLDKSTVDEYSRRMKAKIEKAAVTQNELSEFL